MGGFSHLLSQSWSKRFRETLAIGNDFDYWTVHMILVGSVYAKTGRSSCFLWSHFHCETHAVWLKVRQFDVQGARH